MKKDPVSKEDIRAAAAALAADGKKVTQRSVLDAIGRGSFSTIARYLAEIEAEETNHFNSPAVRELMGKLWEQALAGAAKGYEEKVRLEQEKVSDALAEVQKLEVSLTKARTENAAFQSQKDELISAVAKGTEELARLRNSSADAADRLMHAEQDLVRARSDLAQERLDHIAAVRAAEAKYSALAEKIATLEIDAARTEAKLEHEVLRLEGEKAAAVAATAEARARLTELTGENVQLRARLEEERERIESIRAQLSARVEVLQDKIEHLQIERVDTEKTHARRIGELEELLRKAAAERPETPPSPAAEEGVSSARSSKKRP